MDQEVAEPFVMTSATGSPLARDVFGYRRGALNIIEREGIGCRGAIGAFGNALLFLMSYKYEVVTTVPTL